MAAGIRVLIENYRIELPGDQPGEKEERVEEAHAEAVYAAQAQGASAMEAGMMATEIAEQLQEAQQAETGEAEVPVEDRHDSPPHPVVDIQAARASDR